MNYHVLRRSKPMSSLRSLSHQLYRSLVAAAAEFGMTFSARNTFEDERSADPQHAQQRGCYISDD